MFTTWLKSVWYSKYIANLVWWLCVSVAKYTDSWIQSKSYEKSILWRYCFQLITNQHILWFWFYVIVELIMQRISLYNVPLVRSNNELTPSSTYMRWKGIEGNIMNWSESGFINKILNILISFAQSWLTWVDQLKYSSI